ncbi:hypothetical protein PRIPAC_74561 [Pristionchus pacificus]|uniref:Uncharacterized protein n=1 Tax=Pristionchus pacificus TaxID=54126 RepID=A0A2A6CFA8_PRIPA|nr:hypothetical protein PRIPAC_74561 [Pristionchus pacificus]|eukprot:PDM76768.1 hypothetical protein PRIPAC_42163 [Pristionchus pacificus]
MDSNTLSTLPSDIIRTIIHLGNDSLSDLRQRRNLPRARYAEQSTLIATCIGCASIAVLLSLSMIGFDAIGLAILFAIVYGSIPKMEEEAKISNETGNDCIIYRIVSWDGQCDDPAAAAAAPTRVWSECSLESRHSCWRIHNYLIRMDMGDAILELCRTHRVRRLFIGSHSFNVRRFGDFVLQLTGLDVTLDLYEYGSIYIGHLSNFGKSQLFWDKTTAVLSAQEVTLTMVVRTETDEANFDYDKIRAHIRCERTSDSN